MKIDTMTILAAGAPDDVNIGIWLHDCILVVVDVTGIRHHDGLLLLLAEMMVYDATGHRHLLLLVIKVNVIRHGNGTGLTP
jgi:hypothetical protein